MVSYEGFQAERDDMMNGEAAYMRSLEAASRMLSCLPESQVPYVPHPGDLAWWADYLNLESDPVYLRVSPVLEGGEYVGWKYVSPEDGTVDVFLPEGYDSKRIFEYEQGVRKVFGSGASKAILTWICERDRELLFWAEKSGFVRAPGYLLMLKDLRAGISAEFPQSTRARLVSLPADLRARALLQKSAFESSRSDESYIARFEAFTKRPGFALALDVVLEDDSGIVAFARVWLDDRSKVCLLEPVGVRGSRRGRGYGKAVCSYALSLACERGMTSARVVPEVMEEPAVRLYASLGFRAVYEIPTLVKANPL